jgi:hypothetical protein
VECACGWRTVPAWRKQEADARWRIHVGERRAARCIADAHETRVRTTERRVALGEICDATRARRGTVREERWRLRSSRADGGDRSNMLHAVEPAPWQVLNRVRAFVGCSVSALWLGYFATGGVATYEEFVAMLTGVDPMSMRDHDLTAGVLNECFVDEGLGSLVATSDDVLRTSLAGLR